MIFKNNALIALFTSVAVSSSVLSLTSEEIAEAVGNGGENLFTSGVLYISDDGSACDSCTPCPGSSVMSIFNPKGPSFCVDCTSVLNPCDKVKVMSVFKNSWIIKYFSLLSSNDPASDPFSVQLEGSNTHQLGDVYDALEWSELFYTDEVDDLYFTERDEEKDFVFINTQKFSSYAITFGIQASSNKLSVGNYGLVQSCTSQHTSELMEKLSGIKTLPYNSIAPTGGPSLSFAPSAGPTSALTATPFNTATLKTAAALWISDRNKALSYYGHITYWNVKYVTSMHELFRNKYEFNDDLSLWDTSSATSMHGMFRTANKFNADISQWNVSKVADMRNIFNDAQIFNADISLWNVSNVTSMLQVFGGAQKFNANISQWDVSNVTSMEWMFRATNEFNADISQWNVSKVNTMRSMFRAAMKFNANISQWDVSKVNTMHDMFQQASVFNANISQWNVGQVSNMGYMFRSTRVFNANISQWNVGQVSDMVHMFSYAKGFNVNVSQWNIGQVSDMNNMFNSALAFNHRVCWDINGVTSFDIFYASPGSIGCD